jgi:ubiquitin-like protein Pup
VSPVERTERDVPAREGGESADVSAVPARPLLDDIDELLDEIDEVLEENAEEFVRGYVQKGGE